jgi:DNA-binding XRE family transcriptional regulator
MMKVQFIRTAKGEDLAILPRAEYDRLCDLAEDRADAEAANRMLARIEAGEEEILPGAVVERLLVGENPIKVWRKHRGLTQAGLAEAAGLNKAYISQLETGVRRGSMETLSALSDILRVELDDLAGAARNARKAGRS